MEILMLLLLLFALVWTHVLADDGGVYARDGEGKAVSWWVVLKLPAHVRLHPDEAPIQTPCDCPAPNCNGILPTPPRNPSDRAAGLCYLYADAKNPTLRYFRELGYDCLGQGGNDPVSHTLLQIQGRKMMKHEENETYWALFNDQYNGIAQINENDPVVGQNKTVCGGGDLFSAHAKGAIGFRLQSGGFYLQTSTPNYPDPSVVDASQREGDTFIPLGCQKDDNVHFAQHFLGLSMEIDELHHLSSQLQVARLCSGNLYQSLREQLASANLLGIVDDASVQDVRRSVFDALLNPDVEPPPNSSVFSLQLKPFFDQSRKRSKVFADINITSLNAWADAQSKTLKKLSAERVDVIVKSPNATVPPWALAAETLQVDLSVASWWDGAFGIPNICAGDNYSSAMQQFCINDSAHGVRLDEEGCARYNVENLIEAAWEVKPSKQKMHWHLVGGRTIDGNHAKWSISTPHQPQNDSQLAMSTFADLNMEGFPCSRRCNGSQAGRGGSFFTISSNPLHQALTSLVSRACACVSSPDKSSLLSHRSFEILRMCEMGCWRKIEANLQLDDLPIMSRNASSFWISSSVRLPAQ